MLDGIFGPGLDGALPVQRLPQRVDDPTQHFFPNRDFHDFAGTADHIPFFYFCGAAQQNDPHFIFPQVLHHAVDAVVQGHQLTAHGSAQPAGGTDPIADFFYHADFFQIHLVLEVFHALAQGFRHIARFFQVLILEMDCLHQGIHFLQLPLHGGIEHMVSVLDQHATHHFGIHFLLLDLHRLPEFFHQQFFQQGGFLRVQRPGRRHRDRQKLLSGEQGLVILCKGHTIQDLFPQSFLVFTIHRLILPPRSRLPGSFQSFFLLLFCQGGIGDFGHQCLVFGRIQFGLEYPAGDFRT